MIPMNDVTMRVLLVIAALLLIVFLATQVL